MDVKEIREKFGLSQQELADKTGIPKDRIAKWEQGKGSPKAQDSEVLKKLFKEYVPRENGNTTVSDFKPQHGHDYKDRYLQLLEELHQFQRHSEKDRANLEKSLKDYVQVNQALLKAISQTLTEMVAKLDKKKLADAHLEMNKRVAQHLDVLRKGGI